MLFFVSWQRVGTIVNLNRNDIDFDGGINKENKKRYHMITYHAKQNAIYDSEIDKEVADAIKAYLKIRKNPIDGYIEDNYRRKLYHKDAVFINKDGRRLQARSINNMMKNYALKAGICKRIHSHLWRASGITIADSNNVPLGQIMARSGHSNIQSVTPYLNANKDETNRNITNALSFNKEQKQDRSLEGNSDTRELLKRIERLEQENEKLKDKLTGDYMFYG